MQQSTGNQNGPNAASMGGMKAAAAPDAGLTFSEWLETAPVAIKDYLLSAETDANYARIVADGQLEHDDIAAVIQTVSEVFFRTLSLKDFAAALRRLLKWPASEDGRFRRLAAEIAGRLFLPAQAYLGDVIGLIVGLGGDPAAYANRRPLEMRLMNYADGAKQMVAMSSLGLTDAVLRRRLEHVVEMRLREVRDDGETEEQLLKPVKLGGLGLDAETVGRLISLIQSEIRTTTFVEKAFRPAVAAESGPGSLTPRQIREIYSGSAAEQQAIAAQAAKIRQETDGRIGVMLDWLYAAMFPAADQPADPWAVTAAVLLLAQAGALAPGLVAEDARFGDLVATYLEENHLEQELAAFKEDPNQPRFFDVLLQILLRVFAGLRQADAARFGLRAVNYLKKKVEVPVGNLAAFDAEAGEFKWLKPIDV